MATHSLWRPDAEPGTFWNPLPYEPSESEHVAANMAGVWHCQRCTVPIGCQSSWGSWYPSHGYLAGGLVQCGACAETHSPRLMKHAKKGRAFVRRVERPGMWIMDLDLTAQRRTDKAAKREQWRREQTEWHIRQGFVNGPSGETKCEYNAGEL